jgi:hypothetical protein
MSISSGAVRCVIVVLVAALAGCAAGVKRHDDPAKREAYFAGGGKVAREVTVAIADGAKTSLADNPGFDREQLLAAIRRVLDEKGVLAKAGDASLPTIEIVVTGVRVRSTFSAVMFGFMAGQDMIAGDVIARDAGGKEVQRFQVSAEYALGGFGGGQEAMRMGWLYDSFANEVHKELTGSGS